MNYMSDKPTRRRWPWAAVLVIAALGYAGGYFGFSEHGPEIYVRPDGAVIAGSTDVRRVEYPWMVAFYEPLRVIESVVRGGDVPLLAK